ncbi:MAG: hypothetical protein FJX77_10660, partial [Armatimonadetes bacterium]|nr:hypothetical protein [Armatimonadota bacterium]
MNHLSHRIAWLGTLLTTLAGCSSQDPTEVQRTGPPAPPGAAVSGGGVVFRDVAAEAGLAFTPDPALKPPLNILQT